MTLKIRAILLAVALVMPQACPVMAMGPSAMDEHGEEPSMHEASAGWAMAARPSLERMTFPVLPCCPMAEEMIVAPRGSAVPPTGAFDLLVPPVACSHIVTCDNIETAVPQDSAGPPPTFEQRSMMKRE